MEFKGTPVRAATTTGEMALTLLRAPQNGTKRVLFDVAKDGQNIAPKYVPPEDEQEPYESRR